MEEQQKILRIKKLRSVIREHRDQKGDDRCWIDDYMVWNELPETKKKIHLPTYDEGMERCRKFYENRNSDHVDEMPKEAICDQTRWDEDLSGMNYQQLIGELFKLEDAIKKHYQITGRERTFHDDQELYDVLPEKIPADFRLPCKEEFLGTAKPGAGCPNFWRSHQYCETEKHDLHEWGPCR